MPIGAFAFLDERSLVLPAERTPRQRGNDHLFLHSQAAHGGKIRQRESAEFVMLTEDLPFAVDGRAMTGAPQHRRAGPSRTVFSVLPRTMAI